MLAVAVGVGTGLLSSFTIWLLLSHHFRPTLEWCENLARFRRPSGEVRVQARLKNVGRREVFDTRIHCRLKMGGLLRPGIQEFTAIYELNVPRLGPGESIRFTLGARRIVDELKEGRRMQQFGGQIHARWERGEEIPLDELLRATPEYSSVECSAVASDGFSGTRSVSVRSYDYFDMRNGRFVGKSCVIREGATTQPDEI